MKMRLTAAPFMENVNYMNIACKLEKVLLSLMLFLGKWMWKIMCPLSTGNWYIMQIVISRVQHHRGGGRRNVIGK